MKSFIIADYTNFGKYGGIEKNAELITNDLEKQLDLKIKRVVKKSDLIILLIKSIIRFKFVDYFICYKNSSLTGLIFKIFGTKLIIRFNNSPESYLFWFKLNDTKYFSRSYNIYFKNGHCFHAANTKLC